MAELKLQKLPDRRPVKITISLPPELNRALAAYVQVYNETYGAREPAQALIPAMLASFIQSDRLFAQRRRNGEPS